MATTIVFTGTPLRDARHKAEFTQQMTARLADCHPSTLMQIERSGYPEGDGPAPELIARLCELLSVASAVLYDEVVR